MSTDFRLLSGGRTAVGVDLVEGVGGQVQHLHVGPELFDERLDDGARRRRRRDAHALGGDLLAGILPQRIVHQLLPSPR